MAVDDVAVLALHAELVEDAVAHGGVVPQFVVPPFLFGMRFPFGYEVSFERGHLRFVEKWRVRAAPKIPEKVECFFFVCRFSAVIECCADHFLNFFEKFLAFYAFLSDADFAKAAILVQGDGCVEEQV